jgi:hypothetical protein
MSVPEGTMAWKVGSVHEQSDFIGFNIIDTDLLGGQVDV